MKGFSLIILNILVSATIFAQAESPLFDYETLIDIDSRAQQVLAEQTGTKTQEEGMKLYFKTASVQNSPEFKELRQAIQSYLRSTPLKTEKFKAHYVILNNWKDSTNQIDQIRKDEAAALHISKITVQLLFEDLYSSLVLMRTANEDYRLSRLNINDYVRVQLSPIFDSFNQGGKYGPGNHWKSYAKEATTALYVLAIVANRNEGNIDGNSYAYSVAGSDHFMALSFLDFYTIPTHALLSSVYGSKQYAVKY